MGDVQEVADPGVEPEIGKDTFVRRRGMGSVGRDADLAERTTDQLNYLTRWLTDSGKDHESLYRDGMRCFGAGNYVTARAHFIAAARSVPGREDAGGENPQPFCTFYLGMSQLAEAGIEFSGRSGKPVKERAISMTSALDTAADIYFNVATSRLLPGMVSDMKDAIGSMKSDLAKVNGYCDGRPSVYVPMADVTSGYAPPQSCMPDFGFTVAFVDII